MKRPRGKHGRFLTGDELAAFYRENPERDLANAAQTLQEDEAAAAAALEPEATTEVEEPVTKRFKEEASATTFLTDAYSAEGNAPHS